MRKMLCCFLFFCRYIQIILWFIIIQKRFEWQYTEIKGKYFQPTAITMGTQIMTINYESFVTMRTIKKVKKDAMFLLLMPKKSQNEDFSSSWFHYGFCSYSDVLYESIAEIEDLCTGFWMTFSLFRVTNWKIH